MSVLRPILAITGPSHQNVQNEPPEANSGLSYINTRNCSAGNGADPLFMTPGGYRWDHSRVCPAGFGLKVPGPIKTGPKPRTVRLKKKVRALFDVVWSVFSTDLPCVSARTHLAAGLKLPFPHALETAARPKSAGPSRQKSRGFRLKGLVWRTFSHAFCLGMGTFFKNTLLLTSFSLSVWTVWFKLTFPSNLEPFCEKRIIYDSLV